MQRWVRSETQDKDEQFSIMDCAICGKLIGWRPHHITQKEVTLRDGRTIRLSRFEHVECKV